MSRSRIKPWVYLGLILLAFSALIFLVSPFHEFPVQDDWDYARTVSILLRTGAFERSQIAQASELASALWGALFAAVFGFSFNTLRFSTLSLRAAVSCAAVRLPEPGRPGAADAAVPRIVRALPAALSAAGHRRAARAHTRGAGLAAPGAGRPRRRS